MLRHTHLNTSKVHTRATHTRLVAAWQTVRERAGLFGKKVAWRGEDPCSVLDGTVFRRFPVTDSPVCSILGADGRLL